MAASQPEFAFRATTVSAAKDWQPRARAALRRLLGLDLMDAELADHQVTVDIVTKEELAGYTRYRAIMRTEPDVELPFWVLKPAAAGPYPLALLPHGHTDWGADQYVGLYRTEAELRKIVTKHKDLAVQAVRRGFLCVVPTTRGFEPVRAPGADGESGRPCHRQLVRCLMAGRTPLGERLWDLLHVLDWACARPDVDVTRTLVIGHSGGGVLSAFAAALDERITVAAANESVCPFATDDGRTLWCDCNTIPGLLRWGQAWDLIGLIAPRHLIAVNGRDGLYPPGEVSRTVEMARRCYAVFGHQDNLESRFGDAGCLFYEQQVWSMVESVIPGLVPGHSQTRSVRAGPADRVPPVRLDVSLRPVRLDNVKAVVSLAVHPHQQRFLPDNGMTVSQALLRPATWLRAIYAGEEPVGVVAVVERRPTPEWAYLWRFMIGAAHQGHGYGATALSLVLAEFAGRAGTRYMYLKYVPEPGSARRFYQRAGFRDTGEGDGQDALMAVTLSGGESAKLVVFPC